MSTSIEQELRHRDSAGTEHKDDRDVEEEEVIKIPSRASQTDSDSEPGPITKQTLISLLIILFSVFLDYTGMSILTPILPFYAEISHASSTELGALYSSYSAMLFLASLFMGKVSDIFGRKPMICFSLFGTASGFLVCGLAQNYGQLLAARFFTGIFGATVTIILISIYFYPVTICIYI